MTYSRDLLSARIAVAVCSPVDGGSTIALPSYRPEGPA